MDRRNIIHRARTLRRRMTTGEVVLWSIVRDSGLGWKFRRQHPIGYRIADFACPALRVVVEIDGCSHLWRYRDDCVRERQFEALGWHVIRVSERDVLADRIGVGCALEEALRKRARELGLG
jgi:very-short-patch-repair endonuclease